MSSTISSSSAFPSQTVSSDNNNGSSSMQRGANYFFGFLITFVALLLLFVGCGVGSRRSRRRGLMAGLEDPWGDGFTQSRVTQLEPEFWEPVFTKGGDEWATMMPLSMTTVSPLVATTPSDAPINPPDSRTSRSRQAFLFPSLSYHSWLSSPRQTAPESEKSVAAEEPVPQTLQLSVMIAMPSMPRYPNDRQEDPPPPEYQFGIAELPWDKGSW